MYSALMKLKTMDRRHIAVILITLMLLMLTIYTIVSINSYNDEQLRLMVTTAEQRAAEVREKDPVPIIPSVQDRAAAHKREYPLAMGFVILSYLGISYWNYRRKAGLQTYFSCLFLLAGIGCSYKVMFEGFYGLTGESGFLVLTLAAGIICYQIWSRCHQQLSSPMYYGLCLLNLILLIWVTFFGVTVNGNRGWINLGFVRIQAGEFIKIILIVLGACAMNGRRRRVVYCLSCLLSCGMMVINHDLGMAAVLLFLFLFMTWIIYDKKRYAVIMILLGVAVLYVVYHTTTYVQDRLDGYLHAMTNPNSSQQRSYIIQIIKHGWTGMGVAAATPFTRIVAAGTDAAVAGILAVYGLPMLLVVMGCYICLLLCFASNQGVDVTCHPVLFQTATVIFTQVILNFCGALDLLPFTGVTAVFLSTGGSSMLATGALFGIATASMRPNLRNLSEKEA